MEVQELQRMDKFILVEIAHYITDVHILNRNESIEYYRNEKYRERNNKYAKDNYLDLEIDLLIVSGVTDFSALGNPHTLNLRDCDITDVNTLIP
jgi:hypothetical protein